MREKAVDTGLLHRRIENELGSPVLVLDCGVVVHGYATEGLAPGRQTVFKHSIVGAVHDCKQDHRRQKRSQSDPPETWGGFVAGFVPRFLAGLCAGFVDLERGHGLNYTRAQWAAGPRKR